MIFLIFFFQNCAHVFLAVGGCAHVLCVVWIFQGISVIGNCSCFFVFFVINLAPVMEELTSYKLSNAGNLISTNYLQCVFKLRNNYFSFSQKVHYVITTLPFLKKFIT